MLTDERAGINPLWIGIQGGTCSGKSLLAEDLSRKLGTSSVARIPLDGFYTPFERKTIIGQPSAHNYDDPTSVDWDLFESVARALDAGLDAQVPIIDYVSGLRIGSMDVEPKPYIVVEGLWPFYSNYLVERLDLRVFVDAPADVRLTRLIERNIVNGLRGWALPDLLSYYMVCIRPMHAQYVEPGRELADVIVDGMTSVDPQVSEVLRHLARARRLPGEP